LTIPNIAAVSPRRFLAVAALSAGLASAVAAAAAAPTHEKNPCLDRSRHLRCPDLVMSAPSDLILDRTTHRGHVLLRATSSINNHGSGPLELHGRRSGYRSMIVAQAIHHVHGGSSFFHTGARLGFHFVPGNRYGVGNLGAASYWKFRDAARFGLWRVDRHNRLISFVRAGPKLFYCFRDLDHTRPSRHSPSRAVFPACSQNPGARHITLGTSVGWSDVYPAGYPQQWVDVTGLRGRFAVIQVADPYNRIYERHEGNNASATFIQLPSGRVLGHRVGFSLP